MGGYFKLPTDQQLENNNKMADSRVPMTRTSGTWPACPTISWLTRRFSKGKALKQNPRRQIPGQTEFPDQVGEWMDVPQEVDATQSRQWVGEMNLFKEKDSEVIMVKDDDKKMEISLDTSQYRPDELNVSVANGAITVEGKHEEKAEDGSKMVSR